MTLKRTLRNLAVALPAIALMAGAADAHRRWLMPSATVFSGEKELLSVDAAVSNGLFYFEHVAAPLDDLVVTGPDGQPVAPTVLGKGKYRSVFDVELGKQGTYRVALASDGVMGSYMLAGERKRFRGTGTLEAARASLPAEATEVQLGEVSSRVETFVTLGAPNDTALKPTGRGVELVPVTHPNDLVAGEAAQFRFLLDGRPAAGLSVEFTAGGTRYRNAEETQDLTTDAEGLVTLTAKAPGMYYVEVTPPRPAGGAGGPPRAPAGRRASYAAVLEFMPQ